MEHIFYDISAAFSRHCLPSTDFVCFQITYQIFLLPLISRTTEQNSNLKLIVTFNFPVQGEHPCQTLNSADSLMWEIRGSFFFHPLALTLVYKLRGLNIQLENKVKIHGNSKLLFSCLWFTMLLY